MFYTSSQCFALVVLFVYTFLHLLFVVSLTLREGVRGILYVSLGVYSCSRRILIFNDATAPLVPSISMR